MLSCSREPRQKFTRITVRAEEKFSSCKERTVLGMAKMDWQPEAAEAKSRARYPGYPLFHDSRQNLFGTFRAKTRETNPGKATPDCLRIVNAPNAPPLEKRPCFRGMRNSSVLPMLRTARVFGDTRAANQIRYETNK